MLWTHWWLKSLFMEIHLNLIWLALSYLIRSHLPVCVFFVWSIVSRTHPFFFFLFGCQYHRTGVLTHSFSCSIAFASKVLNQTLSTPEDLLNASRDPKVIAAFLKDLNQSVIEKLVGFEKIRQLYLTMELFSTENDLLTPTLKLKRFVNPFPFFFFLGYDDHKW